MVPVGIQNKTPDDFPVEEKALELPDREFKSLILTILQELRQKDDKHEEKIEKFMENTDKKNGRIQENNAGTKCQNKFTTRNYTKTTIRNPKDKQQDFRNG